MNFLLILFSSFLCVSSIVHSVALPVRGGANESENDRDKAPQKASRTRGFYHPQYDGKGSAYWESMQSVERAQERRRQEESEMAATYTFDPQRRGSSYEEELARVNAAEQRNERLKKDTTKDNVPERRRSGLQEEDRRTGVDSARERENRERNSAEHKRTTPGRSRTGFPKEKKGNDRVEMPQAPETERARALAQLRMNLEEVAKEAGISKL